MLFLKTLNIYEHHPTQCEYELNIASTLYQSAIVMLVRDYNRTRTEEKSLSECGLTNYNAMCKSGLEPDMNIQVQTNNY